MALTHSPEVANVVFFDFNIGKRHSRTKMESPRRCEPGRNTVTTLNVKGSGGWEKYCFTRTVYQNSC